MKLKRLEEKFTVCKIVNIADVNFADDFWFLSKTDEELSLVCQTGFVPNTATECDDGWRAFRIQGILDFSLIGILSKISTILADNEIGIFVVSTYNTDYVLVKEQNFNRAIEKLENEGYEII